MKRNNKIIIILIILALAYVNHFVLNAEDEKVSSDNGKQVVSNSVGSVTAKKSTGKALIGGNFELVDQDGNKFTDQELMGKISMIYFGFTNCPMICPTALSSMTLAMNEIDPEGKEFRPVFITTDPARDDVARLKEYLSSFHSSTVGLTGDKENLEKAYKGYKVYAKKVDIEGTDNYDMNHSSIIYVMDKNGEYVAHFNHETKVEKIISKLKSIK